jgi:hypothetical protein
LIGNDEVLHTVKEERNILHVIHGRKTNRIAHILRRNCLLKHIIEGKIQGKISVTGRQGRRLKQLMDDLKEARGNWKFKGETRNRTMWRTGYGRGCGRAIRMAGE